MLRVFGEYMRQRWTGLAVLTLAGLFAVLVSFLCLNDPKWIPIAQGTLPAMATAGVGWVLWRFQVQSQKNAIMLEHYKAQSGVIKQVMILANEMRDAPYNTQTMVIDMIRTESTKDKMYDFLRREEIWLPNEIVRLSYQFTGAMGNLADALTEGENAEVIAREKAMTEAYSELRDACRRHLHSDRLTEATAAVMKEKH